jgi:hypothetical protein
MSGNAPALFIPASLRVGRLNAANGAATETLEGIPMKYVLAIYGDESARANATAEQGAAMMQAYDTLTREMEQAGALVAGEGLQPSSTATTVRVRDGERLLTDGPFAETRETLAGFYLVDVEDLDAALAWAAKIPHAAVGSIEVRPTLVYDDVRSNGAEREAAASS